MPISEIADKYRMAVNGFSAVVDAVPADQWAAPSPCEGWTAKHVVGHVIGGMGRVSGEDAGGSDPAELAGDSPAVTFAKARDAALAALTPDNLAKEVAGPMGEMPLEQLVANFLTPDVLVHTWDLARAAGLSVTLDQGLVKEAYDRVLPMDAMIRMPGVFGPKVDPPAGADLQTELMCFLGRPA